VCGGRGRCSTCRVKIVAGANDLDSAEPAEVSVLERIGAPPDVRLACQTRPRRDIEIVPLVLPGSVRDIGRSRAGTLAGRERELVILFADLRNFTSFAEKKLPYDVVFILNQYFNAMGSAISDAGGRVDKFLGDGVMALFGIEQDIVEASRQALTAVEGMAKNLADLNATLHNDLEQPLRMGIGVHSGPVIVGEMGFAGATSVTAIGDAVNTASRLEALTKEFGVQAVVSDSVAEYAGVDLTRFEGRDVSIRGRREPLHVRLIPEAVDLVRGSRVLAAE
jgi:adenylate cyclase